MSVCTVVFFTCCYNDLSYPNPIKPFLQREEVWFQTNKSIDQKDFPIE